MSPYRKLEDRVLSFYGQALSDIKFSSRYLLLLICVVNFSLQPITIFIDFYGCDMKANSRYYQTAILERFR